MTFIPYLSSEVIRRRVVELGREISQYFQEEPNPPVFVATLKGSMIFFADLVREVDCDLVIDTIRVKSYAGTESGELRLLADVGSDVSGRTVVIVEDIVDTGATIEFLHQHFTRKGAVEVLVATCLVKSEKYRGKLPMQWTGFEIPPEFVIGYGLDYNERFRQLPGIYCKQGKEF